jgi:hypothetical protein
MKPAGILLLLPMPSVALASTARATVRSRQRIWLWVGRVGWGGKAEGMRQDEIGRRKTTSGEPRKASSNYAHTVLLKDRTLYNTTT